MSPTDFDAKIWKRPTKGVSKEASKSDNLTQMPGLLTKDVSTNEKMSFAAFTIGRKVGDDTLYMNCIAFTNKKFKIPFDTLANGNEVFAAGYLRHNK